MFYGILGQFLCAKFSVRKFACAKKNTFRRSDNTIILYFLYSISRWLDYVSRVRALVPLFTIFMLSIKIEIISIYVLRKESVIFDRIHFDNCLHGIDVSLNWTDCYLIIDVCVFEGLDIFSTRFFLLLLPNILM